MSDVFLLRHLYIYQVLMMASGSNDICLNAIRSTGIFPPVSSAEAECPHQSGTEEDPFLGR